MRSSRWWGRSRAWTLGFAGVLLGTGCLPSRHAPSPVPPPNLQAAVAVDTNGNQVVAGSFAGTLQIAGALLTSAGGTDIFIAKTKPDGTAAWPPQRFGSTGDDAATGVAVDQDGSLVVVGSFQGELALGPLISKPTLKLRGSAQHAVFVAKFDANGKALWVRQIAVTDTTTSVAVAIRPDHSIAVGGGVFGAVKGQPYKPVENPTQKAPTDAKVGASVVFVYIGPNGDAVQPSPPQVQGQSFAVGCNHAPCVQGGFLNALCDWCVGTICSQDSFCCGISWDAQCTNEVWTICGQRCSCNDKCTVGARINAYACACVGEICSRDDYCTLQSWDSICVGEVFSVCGITCP